MWSRIRGQFAIESYVIVTVGQHARNGSVNVYFAHIVHMSPIEAFFINGIHVAGIGESVMCLSGISYIENIGCAASQKEASELKIMKVKLPSLTQIIIFMNYI